MSKKSVLIPREPERIDRMIELLREAWHLLPDLRLTQLVIVASELEPDFEAIFCLEDTDMERKLQRLVVHRRTKLKARGNAA